MRKRKKNNTFLKKTKKMKHQLCNQVTTPIKLSIKKAKTKKKNPKPKNTQSWKNVDEDEKIIREKEKL